MGDQVSRHLQDTLSWLWDVSAHKTLCVMWRSNHHMLSNSTNHALCRPPGFPNFGAGGAGAGGFSMPPGFGGPAAQSSPVDTTARTVGARPAEQRSAL